MDETRLSQVIINIIRLSFCRISNVAVDDCILQSRTPEVSRGFCQRLNTIVSSNNVSRVISGVAFIKYQHIFDIFIDAVML